ncbi:NYN domain-containing protein [Paenibacillus sp. OK076]|uniref:NYN domain-containing protein n=1 Tax=Paenibacillus sp. OK076 TaxID=1884379 RepID=UPI0008B4009E|nr:NYN domain-containing protein [Paenibacillus sp. OK076]SEM96703.1 TIGR00288 family protein [Paenibacillus sp. OK076]
MRDIDDLKKIAVLIDADNSQRKKMKYILEEVSTNGHIITKRAYGDWSKETLKNWKNDLNELAIQPVQQFAYTTGKNATDSAMIIDAMDLLYTNKYDAFVIISSDSDFTKLATRLKESEIFVIGVGEDKTPISFRNACDDFILTENLGEKADEELEGEAIKLEKGEENEAITEVVALLIKAHEKYEDEDGWCNVSAAGTFIKRIKPDFDVRTFGVTKLPELLERLNTIFKITKFKGKGTVNIVAYKPIK